MKILVIRLAILCALLLAAGVRAEVVNVYTSANFAPLMLADGRGIYPDLIAHLNRKKPGGWTFRLLYMPRKRLQVKLEEGSLDGLVIGLMPTTLRVYPMPGPGTERRFLVQRRQAAVFVHLAPAARKLREDPQWRRTEAAYE